MKKIRILTFWNVPNYGSFMQAYALQRIIESRYAGCDVKQLPHLHKKHYDTYYSDAIGQYAHRYVNPRFYKALLSHKKRVEEVAITRKFLDYYEVIPHEPYETELTARDEPYDLLILGSDIIWDYTIGFFGDDPYLFGLGIDAKKKISYAPSFGTVSGGSSAPEYVKTGLNQLAAVSVRDEKSRKLVREISGKDAVVVLDPTLMWDFDSDDHIVKPGIEHYIIVYGSFFTAELVRGARKYAAEHGLKLICLSSLSDRYDWCDQTIDQDQLNPFEWVGYFKYADAVMTCTYHGLMFSLIFKKRIIFRMTDFIMEKASSLADSLGLREVLVEYRDFNSKINWNWDYQEIDARLEAVKADSLRFLDEAIANG